MTAEELWDKYINESSLVDLFEDTCEFFSKEIPPRVIVEYDVEDIIMEAVGQQEGVKNFDNIARFSEILQKNQPELYRNYFHHFNDKLIYYFCFKQDRTKVAEAFSFFIEEPLRDAEIYLSICKNLLFYQYSELLEDAINQNYDAIDEVEELMGVTAYDLAICKVYAEFQRVFEEKKENLDRVAFLSKLSKYNIDFIEEVLLLFEMGVLKPQLNKGELTALFANDTMNSVVVLQGYFQRHMHEKGFEFYLSGRIWDSMIILWEKNRGKNQLDISFDAYFTVETAVFEKYLTDIFHLTFMENTPEMFAILWGSYYIYEFLHKREIISTETFHNFIETSRILKGKLIGQYTSELWISNFVHQWEKPETISEAEFREEKKIFQKSILLDYAEFDDYKESLSEELSKIGELSHYIIEGGKDTSARINVRDTWDNLLQEFLELYRDNENIDYETDSEESKVGRNDPCPCGSGKKYKKCCG